MSYESSLIDAIVGSRHFSDATMYLSREEAALDIALIAYDARLTPEMLQEALLTIENAQNTATTLEKINTLVGISGLALGIYTQFFSPNTSTDRPPQVQQQQIKRAFENGADTSKYKMSFKQPTDAEIQNYLDRYEMRKAGELLRRPEPPPHKKGPYFDESIRRS